MGRSMLAQRTIIGMRIVDEIRRQMAEVERCRRRFAGRYAAG